MSKNSLFSSDALNEQVQSYPSMYKGIQFAQDWMDYYQQCTQESQSQWIGTRTKALIHWIDRLHQGLLMNGVKLDWSHPAVQDELRVWMGQEKSLGLPPSPKGFNPYSDVEEGLKAKGWVLQDIQGWIETLNRIRQEQEVGYRAKSVGLMTMEIVQAMNDSMLRRAYAPETNTRLGFVVGAVSVGGTGEDVDWEELESGKEELPFRYQDCQDSIHVMEWLIKKNKALGGIKKNPESEKEWNHRFIEAIREPSSYAEINQHMAHLKVHWSDYEQTVFEGWISTLKHVNAQEGFKVQSPRSQLGLIGLCREVEHWLKTYHDVHKLEDQQAHQGVLKWLNKQMNVRQLKMADQPEEEMTSDWRTAQNKMEDRLKKTSLESSTMHHSTTLSSAKGMGS